MTLDQLKASIARGVLPALEVHALDPILYVIYIADDGRLQPICDQRGATLKYRSRHAAQQALADTGATTAAFVHRSAYGEMVGLAMDGADTELREVLYLTRE
jgi:hypothetical protein